MSPPAPTARFRSSRRLKRRSLIEPLFDRQNPEGGSVFSGCVRIVYRFVAESAIEAPFQIGVAVGRSHGNAPQRNRIKRILRDVIRHDQERLERIARSRGMALTAMVLFQGQRQDSQTIRRDVDKTLEKLEERARQH